MSTAVATCSTSCWEKVLGATAAAQLAQDLEARGRAGDLSDARELGASLEAEIERILQSLPIAKRK